MAIRSIFIISLFTYFAAFACKKEVTSELRSEPSKENEVTVSILGLNDLHGGGLSVSPKILSNSSEKETVEVGGPAAMKAYFQSIEANNPGGSLILDAGDSYQGSLVSNNTRGQAVVSLYNFLGVAASNIGNHEFDWGGILSTSVANESTYESPFLRIVEKANYPFLAHNMTFQNSSLETVSELKDPNGKPYQLKFKSGKPKLAKYAVFLRNGVKIAVVGGITATAMDSSSTANYRDVTIKPIGEGLGKLIEKIKSQKEADGVVLLLHAGFACGFGTFDYQTDTKNTSDACPEVTSGTDEIRSIFAALKKDGYVPSELIDAVVAGHVHAPQAHYYEGVPVIQNADKGLGFGRIDLKFNKQKKSVEARKIFPPALFCHSFFENYPGCDTKGPDYNRPFPAAFGRRVAPIYDNSVIDIKSQEKAATAALADYSKLLSDKDKPITTLNDGLVHDRFVESVMSRCYVDAIALSADADIVIAISGGIRESLPKGEVTAGHIFEVAPFDGGAVEVAMTGKELESYIKLKNKDFNHKSMPIVSDGWKMKVSCAAPGEAVSPVDIYQHEISSGNWNKVDENKTYKVVVSGYLFENKFFDDFRASRSKVLPSDRDLFTTGFSRNDRPASCMARPQVIKKCDDSHDGSRWCGLTRACP